MIYEVILFCFLRSFEKKIEYFEKVLNFFLYYLRILIFYLEEKKYNNVTQQFSGIEWSAKQKQHITYIRLHFFQQYSVHWHWVSLHYIMIFFKSFSRVHRIFCLKNFFFAMKKNRFGVRRKGKYVALVKNFTIHWFYRLKERDHLFLYCYSIEHNI